MAAIRFAFVLHCLRDVQGLQSERQNAVLAKTGIANSTEQACIGIMCGRRAPVSLLEGKLETYVDYELRGRHPFCAPDQSSPSRLLLMPFVAHHHGSDALASVLMSSSEVATLCGAKTWHCDGSGLVTDLATGHDSLEKFSHQWDLKKHVLLAPHPDVKTEMVAFEKELQEGVPKIMQNAGIRRVFLMNLIMWRPICLGELVPSMHNDSVEFAKMELKIMEEQVALHKRLVAAKHPVFVMSLADLLWSPVWSQSRMEKMIPCIGKLNVDAVPELHRHHYPQNAFTFDMSVKQFGEANLPHQFGYNVEKRSCVKSHNAFRHLPDEEQKRARAAVKYLDVWSQ